MDNPIWSQILDYTDLTIDRPAAFQKLREHLTLLHSVNNQMNLTRIDDPAQAELLHVADSLTLLPLLPLPPAGRGSTRLADVGSGGGFPGIPLAIVRPDLRVTLIEATHKKAEFLKHVATKLQLGNVSVIADRSENLRGHQWDIVVTRALAAMDKLVTLCLPLVKPGGKLLAMKGPRGREELPAATKSIRRFRGEEPAIHPANLPGRDHIIIEIRRRG